MLYKKEENEKQNVTVMERKIVAGTIIFILLVYSLLILSQLF